MQVSKLPEHRRAADYSALATKSIAIVLEGLSLLAYAEGGRVVQGHDTIGMARQNTAAKWNFPVLLLGSTALLQLRVTASHKLPKQLESL